MILLKDLMNRFNCDNTVHESLPRTLTADTRSSYIANSSVLGLDKADFILLIGTNPRVEAPVYNARIRKMFLNGSQVISSLFLFCLFSSCRAQHSSGSALLQAETSTCAC
jgi:NADH dehydrogenase (ubiquinone) Fe-S protein 1